MMDSDSLISLDAMSWDNIASILPSPSAPLPQSASSQQAHVPTPASAPVNGSKRKQKKVRSACERCRYRRVKCDGQVPACGSCAKAGAQCIDIDSRDAERRLMRGSFEQATARIAWLEEIIRTQLPHINLDSDDPFACTLNQAEYFGGISGNTTEPLEAEAQIASSSNYVARNIQDNATPETGSSVTSHHQPYPARGTKRPLSDLNARSTHRRKSIDREARSMALELGLLSLDSNSHQMHYLGSSSGSLFTPLFLTTKKSGSGKMPDVGAQRGVFYRDSHGRNEILQVNSGMPSQSDILDVQKTIGALYEQLRKDLPPREECNVLLDGFFNHMHPNHPFLHCPSFKCMVDGLYECVLESAAASTQYNGWPLSVQPFSYNGEDYISQGQKLIPIDVHVAAFQLLIALSIGATLQIRRRRYSHNPKVFFDSAMKLSSSVFGCISLPVLQAILLVIVHSLIDPDGCDVWTLTHVAMAYAVDLGIHREVGSLGLFNPAAIEIRRRVFFCVYSLDRSISTIQGRPLGLGDDTFDVHLPELSESQIRLANSGISSDEYNDVATMAYSIQVFKMARMVSRIKSGFYRLSIYTDALDINKDHTNAQKQLRIDLDHWLAESTAAMMESVREDQRFRLNTKLQIQYHAAMCLLHQPSQAVTHPKEGSLEICYNSATERLHLYEALYDSGALCHSWRTVQDTFLAGATIMYCVSISPAVRRSISISSLSRDFRSCSSMLSVGGEWWPTTRKAKYGLERLSNQILDMLADNSYSDGAELRVGQQPFSQDYSPNIDNWQGPEILGSNGLEQTLLSVLNHNGRLIDFFEDTDGFVNSWDVGQITGDELWTCGGTLEGD